MTNYTGWPVESLPTSIQALVSRSQTAAADGGSLCLHRPEKLNATRNLVFGNPSRGADTSVGLTMVRAALYN